MSPEAHQRVRKLFDEALERPEAERLRFLEAACWDDPELLQATRQLLEAHGESRLFLENEPNAVQRLGRYRLTGELGRGAMGIVYEAIDPLIGRTVAVKTFQLRSDNYPGEPELQREHLFREARSAGVLFHPGIVIIFDVGQEGETAYIAMERIEGPSLYQILASGRKIGHAEAVAILRQTASALDYAHQNGVVHRDIKPANIMLHKGVTVKVADFGIAKIASPMHHTRTGMVMGTPSYMSPEQIEARPLDGRSDQFSLGIVAYELLTGTKPFQADSLVTLAHMIVYAPRPSAQAANPELPVGIDDVFERVLRRAPEERYANCAEFVAAVEKVLQNPPRVQQLAEPVRAAQPVKLLYVAGIAAAVLIAVLAFVLYQRLTIPPEHAVSRGVVPPPAAPAVARFTASPESIEAGAPVTLRWEVTGAKQVVIDQGIGTMSPQDTFEVKPLTPTKYVLTATGPGGSVSAQVFVNVTAKQLAAGSLARAREIYTEAVGKRRGGQSSAALALLRQAAAMGEPRAMVDLGVIYEDGEGVTKDDGEAVRWFRKAADSGSSSGMLHLGASYYLGTGVPEEHDAAAYWYSKAASAGNPSAMYNLARMYERGEGVVRDVKKASELYQKSAELGNADAKAELARFKGNR